MKGRERLNSAVRILTGLVGLALVGYFALYFTREATKMSAWRTAGAIATEVDIADSLIVFTRIDPADFIVSPIPGPGDTATAVNDVPVTVALWNSYFDSTFAPGLQVPLSFRSAGQEFRTVVLTRPPPTPIVWLMAVLQVLRFLIAGLSILVGLWAFFARPDSPGVRALAFFSFSMGGFMITGVSALSARFASFEIPYLQYIHQAFSLLTAFFGAFWLNLQLLFPHPTRFIREHPVPAYLLCYAPPILGLAVASAAPLFGYDPQFAFYFVFAAALLQLVFGFVLLAIRYRRAQDRLERRQTRLVLLGSGSGLGLLILLIIVSNILQQAHTRSLLVGLLTVNAAFVGLLLTPLSFAYAFGRYRLLEVEGRLRRGTRYVLTVAGLVAVLGALIYVAGPALKRTIEGGSTVTMIILLALAAASVPGIRFVQGQLEKWFYPERLRLRRMIHDFLQQALSIPDKETFWSELQQRLREGLRVERVNPVLLLSGNGHYRCMVAGATPFTAESEFVGRLAREQRPLLIDEVIASHRVHLTDEEAEWLVAQRVGLVLPLISHSHLIGFLGLGQKTEREDYAAEELRILDSLSPQIALASENIRLLEENIIKKQLEEQLQMARRIQQGFLPQQIPPVHGLEIAAGSRFCLDVAGDYYDVIPLENGRTVLAVGDVSGKGAGAALLMANLQASLRTAVGIGSSLDDVVARVNDLICRNTPVEQYITFFVGVFDPEENTFTYVNAGHNPPMLVKAAGDVRLLSAGGIILGFLPGMRYDQEVVKLAPGDLLVMYTDGVSEAMDHGEQEFGEDRICESVRAMRTEPVSQILSTLESEVVAFRGDIPFEDDFTLLLVRAT